MSTEEYLELNGKTTERSFRELRAWVDQRLIEKGVKKTLPQTRGDDDPVTAKDIELLKKDIAMLMEIEGRRSFWSGLIMNTVFFVLGVIAGILTNHL